MGTPLKIKKPMSRDEVALLVDLVVKRPAITIKETNAANNKLKEDAWNSLAVEFNEISDQPRSREQIKLKWDNLKKAARKRVSQIDKEEQEMVPLGDILDRVSELLGYCKPDAPSGDWIVVDSIGESYSSSAKKRKSESTEDPLVIDKYKKMFELSTGKRNGAGVRERNLAIARYYEKKTEKTELEIKLLKAQLNRQCSCNNSCELNSNNDNKSYINKIKQLNNKLNSYRSDIKSDNSHDRDYKGDNSNYKDDSNNHNNDTDGTDNMISVDIVKYEVESP